MWTADSILATARRTRGLRGLGQADTLFLDSGYDDGAGNVVYSQNEVARSNLFEAIRKDPVPAAIAVGVGIVVVSIALGMLRR